MSNPIVEPIEQLTGTCHCGTVSWRYSAEPHRVTACNCTVCSKAGVLWIYGTEDVDVAVHGKTTCYIRDDHGDLEFHHCPTCGNTICWRLIEPKAGEKRQIAVNLRLADTPEQIMHLPVRHFDGLMSFKETTGSGETVRDIWY